MEDMDGFVNANAAKKVNNNAANEIYYELNGEGDADSSTIPSHNADHRRDRKYDHRSLFCFFCVQSMRAHVCMCAYVFVHSLLTLRSTRRSCD